MDALYKLINNLGINPLDTALLVCIALLARQRFTDLIKELTGHESRLDRIEKSVIAAKIPLLPLE